MLMSVRLLAHDPGEAVASRCRSSWSSSTRKRRVLDERLERVGVLAAVVPGEDAAVRHDRARRLIVHEEVHEIDAVAHPLVGDAARELPVEAELEVQLRIEGTVRLRHQPRLPVRVLLADLLHLGTAAPARAVVVPHDLVLAHVAEGAAAQDLARGQLVRLAAMLRADLDDEVALLDGVARGLHLLEHVAHRLFAVGVLARLHRRLQASASASAPGVAISTASTSLTPAAPRGAERRAARGRSSASCWATARSRLSFHRSQTATVSTLSLPLSCEAIRSAARCRGCRCRCGQRRSDRSRQDPS